MTRWIQEYNQGQFKVTWSNLIDAVSQLEVDDQTVTTTVEELARLKKVVKFVDGIIENADLELTPKSVWTNCNGQAEACASQVRSYIVNRNPAHLVQANEHADNLLTYVRPYMVVPERALDAYGAAVKAFSEEVTDYVDSFRSKAAETLLAVSLASDEAEVKKREVEAVESRLKRFDEKIFQGVDGEVSVVEQIAQMVSSLEAEHKAVGELYKSLLDGPESTSERIKGYDAQISQVCEKTISLLSDVSSKRDELDLFYEKIFGRLIDDSEQREGGLRKELDDRFGQLEKYEGEQKQRHQTLFESIESLLPGATSAGLATAYNKLKDRFNTPIIGYTSAFYASLVVLLLSGLVMVSDSFTLWPFHIEFVKAGDWTEMLRTLLTRAPVMVPVIWFAIFSATRRSQYERLQQEYAHKESIASSYESYKKQLQELKVDSDALQRELIANAISAISYNASKTLDGKHEEKLPVTQILEKLNVDEVKKLVDLVRGR